MNLNKITYQSAAIFLLSLQSLSLIAQRNAEKGDRYFDQNQFEAAIKYYQMDIKSGNKKAAEYALQKLADCYRISGEFEKAEETFKKILKRKKKDPNNYLNYGLSLKNSAKYAEAIVQFEEYVRLKPEDPMGKVYLQSCDSAQIWLDETIGREVKNLDKVNTEYSEFSPVVFKGETIFFSSSREGSTKALVSFDGGGELHRMDVYEARINELENMENQKKQIHNFKEINTPLHEGSASFSSDGKEVYFTKTIKGKKNKETNSIVGTLQVFYCHKDSVGKWTAPVSAFSFNSLDYSVGHPSLSSDGKKIYFMSDKPGGFGKTDIYYCVKQENGDWSKPINAGNLVNTFGYELFPTFSEDSTLYFSSNAHPGMGQLDIFKAEFIDGKWTNVRNLKPPYNSIANDFGITFEGKAKRGFFSSDRFNGKGAEDIYSFSEEVPLQLTFKNDSLSFADKSVYDDIKYQLICTNDSSETDLAYTGGNYHVKLNTNKDYELNARKNGMPYNKIKLKLVYNSLDKTISLSAKSSDKTFGIDTYFATPDTNLIKPEIPSPNSQTETHATDLESNDQGYFKNDSPLEPGRDYLIAPKGCRRQKS